MGIETAIAVVSTAASVYSAVKGASASGQAAKAQKSAQKKQQMIEDEKARRERNQQLKQAVAARATIVNNAANGGVSNSSGVQGGVGSVGTQLGSNLSFLDTVGNLQRGASQDLQRAAGYQQSAANASAFGNLFSSASSTFSGAFSSAPSAPASPWVNPDTGQVWRG